MAQDWGRSGSKGRLELLGGRPGVASLVILAERRQVAGLPFRVEVQPSTRMKKGQYGVFIQTNEHYAPVIEEASADDNLVLKKLLQILNDNWEDAHNYAEHVARHILDWAAR